MRSKKSNNKRKRPPARTLKKIRKKSPALKARKKPVKKQSGVKVVKVRIVKAQPALQKTTRPKTFRLIKNGLLKLTASLLIILINWMGLYAVDKTVAYFSDTEVSEDNSFTDGILDFRMTYDCDELIDVISGFTPYNPIVRNHTVYQEGTLDFQYRVRPLDFSGNLPFCKQLWLTAEIGGSQVFNGRLVDFDYTINYSTSTSVWLYTLSLPPETPPEFQNQTCEFTAVYTGWQQNLPNPHLGLYDTEKKHYSITSGYWRPEIVVNEVFYDVDSYHGSERFSHSDEWIELYNNGSFPVDLKDWTIADNSGEQIISHRTAILQPQQYAVLAKAANTWTYWPIPDSALHIELGQAIGNLLNNDGDRVILKDSLGNVIDMMSYGTDNYAFDPACPDVDEGYSLARFPDGYDTDQATDWVDSSLPTPGDSNTVEQNQITNFSEPLMFSSPNTEEKVIAESEPITLELPTASTLEEIAVEPEPTIPELPATSTLEQLLLEPAEQDNQDSSAEDTLILPTEPLMEEEPMPEPIEPEPASNPLPENPPNLPEEIIIIPPPEIQ